MSLFTQTVNGGSTPTTTTTQVEQLGTGDPDGATLGTLGGYVSLYGVTPVLQAATIAAVVTTDLTTTGILAVINQSNAVVAVLKLLGAIAAA